jgi:hypothetical protein
MSFLRCPGMLVLVANHLPRVLVQIVEEFCTEWLTSTINRGAIFDAQIATHAQTKMLVFHFARCRAIIIQENSNGWFCVWEKQCPTIRTIYEVFNDASDVHTRRTLDLTRLEHVPDSRAAKWSIKHDTVTEVISLKNLLLVSFGAEEILLHPNGCVKFRKTSWSSSSRVILPVYSSAGDHNLK